MATETILGSDEFVTVVHGIDIEPPDELKNHPRVSFIKVGNESSWEGVKQIIPSKTKVFVLTEFVRHGIYLAITGRCKTDNLVYLHRKNKTAVIETVKSYFPEMLSKYKDNAPKVHAFGEGRGKIKAFLEANPPDLTKSTTEEGRRLLGLAQAQDLMTTLGSITQSISKMKREKGLGEIPKSAQRKDPRAEALAILDDAIANLSFIREYVATTSTENEELRSKVNKLKEMFN